MPEADALLEAAGLPSAEVDAWRASAPIRAASFDEAAAATSAHLVRGGELLDRLPARPDRNDDEEAAASALRAALDAERARFLRAHVDAVYDALTDGLRRAVRDEELVYAAAERFPGLAPTRAEVAAERARPLPEKEGL